MSKWKLVEGTSPKFFLAAVLLTIVAAVLYFRSEAQSGWENVQKSKNLEAWAIGVFVAALICWILMFTSAKRNKK